MICDYQTCGLDATRCARTKWSGMRHERNHAVCPIHFESARVGEKLTLGLVGYGPGTIIPCPDHHSPFHERNTMHEDIENDEEVVESNPARRRSAAKKKAKKKSPSTPSVKVDSAQALAFVRARIRDEKDPLVKAFFQRELIGLEERVKKSEEERRAKRYITVAKGEKVQIGARLFQVHGGDRYYHGRHGERPKPKLTELILKDIIEEPRSYGNPEKKAACSIVGGGQKTIDSYSFKSLYTDPRAALDVELNSVAEELKDAEEQVDDVTARRDALRELRNAVTSGTTATPATTTAERNDGEARSRKRWTDEENERLIAMIAQGKTPEAAAEALGRTRDRVVRQMHKLKIKSPSTAFHDFGPQRRDDAPTELEGQRSMFDAGAGIAEAAV